MGMGFEKESAKAMTDALKLLGHVNAPEYRNHARNFHVQLSACFSIYCQCTPLPVLIFQPHTQDSWF